MIVNSIAFWIFFAVVIFPYFVLLQKSAKAQNVWLLLASYFFYGWANWKMLPLLIVVTLLYYQLGRVVYNSNKISSKKAYRWTWLAVVLGICILLYFKYLNFFINEFASFFLSLGFHVSLSTFNIIMPLGISFFTFKLIGYIVEIYRGNIKCEKDLMVFALYVAFFPTILSGPIDTPNKFIPQLHSNRVMDWSVFSESCKKVLWGLFLKLCIADRLCSYTDSVFNNMVEHSAISITLASVFYFLQMYADFCGYSAMAIGVAKMMGLTVAENFNRPFFAQNVAEYWRRWHMSLTSWITTYIFMPLNIKFRNLGCWGLYLATIINLVVIGAWHGANWTYVVFGLYHGLLLVMVTSFDGRRKNMEKRFHLKKKEWYKWTRRLLTFSLCTFGCFLFRINSTSDIIIAINKLSQGFGSLFLMDPLVFSVGLLSVMIMLAKDFMDEYKKNNHFLHSKYLAVRLSSIALLVSYILLFGALEGKSFIYFQF